MRTLAALISALALAALPVRAGGTLDAEMRERTGPDGAIETKRVTWDLEKTAIIVCDMWDKHWCAGATERVAELAPVMDEVLRNARQGGALIIHAPSGTVNYYADTPQREKAINAPKAEMPTPEGWRHLDAAREPELPIDDSDGGCACEPPCPQVHKRVWTRQIETLSIGEDDVISDSGQEIYNVLKAEGRENVIMMGVHTNMCVLGRPFSIRAQINNGFNVALMRDLTDSMYNPRMAPYVDHHRGTGLVIEHIERYWCPTLTSGAFTGKEPFKFK